MKKRSLFLSVPLFCLMLACGGSESGTTSTDANETESTASVSDSDENVEPCSSVSKADIAEIFGVDASVIPDPLPNVSYEGEGFTSVSCNYAWDADGDDYNDEVSVSFSYGEKYTDENAVEMFENAVAYLNKGVSASAGEGDKKQTFTYKGSLKKFDGLGKAAAWQTGKSKYIGGNLMLAYKDRVYTIILGRGGVDNSAESEDKKNLEYAKAVAQKIMDNY